MHVLDNETAIEYVVTLVHGTFAHNTNWIQSNSLLHKVLTSRFNNKVLIIPFQWSGKNNHSSRNKASKLLRNQINVQLQKYPQSRHFIIGHSHGGNVALYALSDTNIERQISGIVCISTPFLVARTRDLGGEQTSHIKDALNVIALSISIPLIILTPSSQHPLLFLVLWTTVALTLRILIPLVIKNWHSYSTELKSELDYPPVNSNKILILHSPADEASGALVFFQFFTQISVRIYTSTYAIYNWLEDLITSAVDTSRKNKVWNITKYVGSLLIIIIAILTYFDIFLFNIGSILGTIALLSLLFCITIVLIENSIDRGLHIIPGINMLISLLIFPIIIILSIFLLPFGWEMALANILLDVTAESTPLGSWTIHLINPPNSFELNKNKQPLMHSTLYDYPVAINIICDWIEA